MDSLRSPQEAATPKKAYPSVAFQSAQGRVLESRSLGMTALGGALQEIGPPNIGNLR